ncbi:MAG TPA: Hsp20/alpha crystallin family protein [Candidatus Bathyarchaeia archaeon]|nr:Hsp20/alpha crystallin family protein [Candidatus Bathyarchaeia archaeon]
MTMALMSKKKGVSKAVTKANKPALAAKEAPSSFTHSVDKMLDTMTLIPWDPFRGFEWPVEYELPTRIPYVDVIDSDNEYVVKAELPGLKKETLNIQVGTNELSLAAESNVETEEEGKTYLHRERAFSTFRRNIGFAESVDTEKVSAKMAEGILEVRLPKLERRSERKTRRITL